MGGKLNYDKHKVNEIKYYSETGSELFYEGMINRFFQI